MTDAEVFTQMRRVREAGRRLEVAPGRIGGVARNGRPVGWLRAVFDPGRRSHAADGDPAARAEYLEQCRLVIDAHPRNRAGGSGFDPSAGPSLFEARKVAITGLDRGEYLNTRDRGGLRFLAADGERPRGRGGLIGGIFKLLG